MKKVILVVVTSLIVAVCAHAESAHKGWGASPAQWPGAKSPSAVIRDVGMQGPWVSIKEPDPPTNAPFQAGYCFKTGSIVTVKKVYILVVGEDGSINTKEIKTTPLRVHSHEVIDGYSYASFSTDKVSFKEGDVFVVVFKADGQTIPVFLKIAYSPFVPS